MKNSRAAVSTGAIQPIWAIVFSEVLENYSEYNCAYNQDISKLSGNQTLNFGVGDFTVDVDAVKAVEKGCRLDGFRDEIRFWAGMFAVLGVGQFIGYGFLNWMFGFSGEYMTTRLRAQSFAKLLRLDMGYFDEPLNSTGKTIVVDFLKRLTLIYFRCAYREISFGRRQSSRKVFTSIFSSHGFFLIIKQINEYG